MSLTGIEVDIDISLTEATILAIILECILYGLVFEWEIFLWTDNDILIRNFHFVVWNRMISAQIRRGCCPWHDSYCLRAIPYM
jgi:hypothetical protein